MSALALMQLRAAVDRRGIVVRVSVIASEGSTPRETGATMLVTPSDTLDTIGGGALEHAAIAAARGLMAKAPTPWRRELLSFPLGPSLGQCCGGYVKLLLELFTAHELATLTVAPDGPPWLLVRATTCGAPAFLVARRKAPGAWPAAVPQLLDEMLSGQAPAAARLVRGRTGSPDWYIEPLSPRRTPLFLYGAGHVGRALVRVLEPLAFSVTWADIARERFPPATPPGMQVVASPDLVGIAAHAPVDAWHLVMTYSHTLDLAICHAVLQHGRFAYLGLIGSGTKRTRFLKRLAALGIDAQTLARLACPIGLEGLRGKEPAVIAVSVAADLLRLAAHAGGALELAEPAPAARTTTEASIGGSGERDPLGLG
jgi:xanthine dehydrogenase accessory factor